MPRGEWAGTAKANDPSVTMAKRRNARRGVRLTVLLSLFCVTSGCALNGPGSFASLQSPASTSKSAFASQAFGPTVAFESVDGPPPQVFDRLVQALDAESNGGRSFSIVSREAPAAFRIRSYLSAQIRRGRTTVAWVWDIYDRDQQRALRLSGEEQGGKAGRDAWAAADDQLLKRIAQAGLNGINSLTNGSEPAATPVPDTTAPNVAVNEPPVAQNSTLAFSTH
jgi:hypothetical protein